MGFLARIKAAFAGGGKKHAGAAAASGARAVSGGGGVRWRGQKFSGGLPMHDLILDSEGARRKVRELSHNSLQLRALIERDADTVVSQGLNLTPEPRHETLGITPEAAREWADDVKNRFELWAASNRASRSGRYNFFQAQRLMRKSLFRDGELFVALSYHGDPSLISPLRFELIDPDQIRENGVTFTASGAGVPDKEGIIRNADGEETAYKVWSTGENGLPQKTVIPRAGRSGRVMMLHAFSGMDYAGQLRGISPLSVCAQDLELLLNFTIAQVNKAVNQSNIVFTVESESDEQAQNLFLPQLPQGLPFGAPKSAEAETEAEAEAKKEGGGDEPPQVVYNEIPHHDFNKPGSTGVFSAPPKQKLKPFPDTSPSQNYPDFVDHNFAYIAAAVGGSVENTLMRYSNNFSASRATLIQTQRIAVQRRWELDYYVLGPIYEMWLSEEIAAGRVSAPGWSDPRLRAAWAAHRYTGPGMPNIDPLKMAKAAKEYTEMGAATLEDAAIEYNDSDAASNRVKLKQELEELRGLGAMPWGKAAPAGEETGDEE